MMNITGVLGVSIGMLVSSAGALLADQFHHITPTVEMAVVDSQSSRGGRAVRDSNTDYIVQADWSDPSVVFENLRAADGDAVVLISGSTDLLVIEGMFASLASSSAQSVRIGISDNISDYRMVRDAVENIAAQHDGWQVCRAWLAENGGVTGTGSATLGFLESRFNGSLVVLDNGANDADRYHPAVGADSVSGMSENPILFGAFDPRNPAGVVQDQGDYRAAWEQGVYGMAQGSDPRGC